MALCIDIKFLALCSICLSPFQFQEWSRVTDKDDITGVYPFDKISEAQFGFEKFLRLFDVLFSFIFAFIIPKCL